MEYKLTSVKILKELYKKFKSSTLDDEFTLQKLVNRSMDLYVLDNKYREKIQSYNKLITSGSRLWIWEMTYYKLVNYSLKLK